jgi:hypothetical protein
MTEANGPNVFQFDSIQGAMDFMETNRIAMSEIALPEQRALADGEQHWYLSEYKGLLIMGEILSLADMRDTEDPETIAMLRENLKRDLVYVKGYSIIEPEGEYGTIHVAALCPASKEAFDEFIAAGCVAVSPEQQPELAKVIQHLINRRLEDRQRKERGQ